MVTESTETAQIESAASSEKPETVRTERQNWIEALKQVLPIYLVTHLVFLVLTYLVTLFRVNSSSSASFHLKTLLTSWNNWDTGWYNGIAMNGYTHLNSFAFFPLLPILERIVSPLTHNNPFYAGLLISNLAGLGMLMTAARIIIYVPFAAHSLSVAAWSLVAGWPDSCSFRLDTLNDHMFAGFLCL